MKIYFIWASWERLLQLNYNIPPLGILRIAGNTPEKHEIKFTDSMVEPVDFESDADIIAISFLTPASLNAYNIAKKFKEKGKYIVLGGVHVTIFPEEAKKHADSIFIGEAEFLWNIFLKDYENGNPKDIYKNDKSIILKNLPEIRRDILADFVYPWDSPIKTGVESMELSRGCSSNCAYCVVPNTQGSKFRNIPLEDINKNFKKISKTPGFIFFVDNNLLGNWDHTEKALKLLIPYEKYWLGLLAPELAAENTKRLDFMVKSGLTGVYGTVKAITGEETKKEINKRINYLKRLRDNEVIILATFALGWDNHDKDVFDRTLDFCFKSELTVPEFIINTPFPGSRLFNKYLKENRIITKDWSKYNGNHTVFKPLQMTSFELEEGYKYCYNNFYKNIDRDQVLIDNIIDRVFLSIKKAKLKNKKILN